jgi:hypothetical protein
VGLRDTSQKHLAININALVLLGTANFLAFMIVDRMRGFQMSVIAVKKSVNFAVLINETQVISIIVFTVRSKI